MAEKSVPFFAINRQIIFERHAQSEELLNCFNNHGRVIFYVVVKMSSGYMKPWCQPQKANAQRSEEHTSELQSH